MKITYTIQKDAVPVRFIEGTLSRFTGAELLIGYGDKKELPRRKVVLLLRKVISIAKQHRLASLLIEWREVRAVAAHGGSPIPLASDEDATAPLDDAALGELLATAFVMADYEFTTYKTPPKEGFARVEKVALVGAPKDAQRGVARGVVIGEGVNACRNLANTPGGDITPKVLADAAKKAAKDSGAGTKISIKILGRKEMEKLGMGAVLGVARGSVHEPQFIVMEYVGAGKSKPIVLVGKGVTFDTGGLNIKTDDHMYEMHLDMSGGAAVIHTVALAAKLKLKANVVGVVPAVENNLGDNAMRPGDILKSLSGKTIEVLNTDAEGRIILADGITYAKRYNPSAVVDVATLTGASLVALGTQASAFMTNEGELIPTVMRLAEHSGDYVWPMPAWEEYEVMTKGTFGDVPNISTDGNSRYGGVIAGGMFLKEFAKDLGCPWVHIDMAPRMTPASNEFLAKGAVGAPVRLLLAIVENGVE